MDKRIDERYEDTVTLICDKCGCICSTKNIERIGNRGIKPVWDGIDNFPINYLALTYCNEQHHLIKDLRRLTDEEMTRYSQEGNATKDNRTLADKIS